MGYDRYKDRNGVTWTVITSNNGFTMVATVLDTADPKYDPPAEDQQAQMEQGGIQVGGTDFVHTDPPTAEQTRTLFIELVGNVEKYAGEHKGAVMLQVTAAAPTPWWVWVGLGLVVLGSRRRR